MRRKNNETGFKETPGTSCIYLTGIIPTLATLESDMKSASAASFIQKVPSSRIFRKIRQTITSTGKANLQFLYKLK